MAGAMFTGARIIPLDRRAIAVPAARQMALQWAAIGVAHA